MTRAEYEACVEELRNYPAGVTMDARAQRVFAKVMVYERLEKLPPSKFPPDPAVVKIMAVVQTFTGSQMHELGQELERFTLSRALEVPT